MSAAPAVPGRVGAATKQRLVAAGLDPDAVEAIARRALAEDLDGGPDVTTAATVPAGLRSLGRFVARAPGVVAGLPVVAAVLDLVLAGDAEVEETARDGDRVGAGDCLAVVRASTAGLLTAERTALNLLSQLSGVATLTRAWVDAVEGTGALVRDTRKTVPGLRALQKYAVRCGGGSNHRMSLSDAALVKDNHVVAAGGVAAAFAAVRARWPDVPVEVECDTVDQVREAVAAGAELVLLDNMSTAELRECVAVAEGRRPAVLLEASGNLSLEHAAEVAGTGVDYLAVGALTHSAPVLDVGLDLAAR